uniref:Alpha-1,3/1,6-mannosyltransferase ALG2 n=1 Tax=Parascaris univalens TaxID=6257 RepID=A0A915C9J4_PARUN
FFIDGDGYLESSLLNFRGGHTSAVTKPSNCTQRMRVTFIHPDLGIGGAERLVVDAALAMQNNGHQVCIVTNHYNPTHTFDDSKQFDIRTIDILPRSIFGRGIALCAYLRMCLAAIYVSMAVDSDLVFCDSVSACLAVFRFFRLLRVCKAPLFFYCHFPDMLLTDRKTALKKVYRYFVDSLESWTMGMADLICVNSYFTRDIVSRTFPKLNIEKVYVLYPTLNTKFFDDVASVELAQLPSTVKYLFVSINRYERKKNIRLAIDAFAELKWKLSSDEYRRCFLVIAGGFDKLNEENLLYHRELKEYAVDAAISTKQILFLRSPADNVKVELLRRAIAVLYTPSNEHFGIVPVEAMYMKTCVIAVNSGGPKESIVDGVSGFLVDAEVDAFANKMAQLVRGEVDAVRIGEDGRKRVESMFTFNKFAHQLEMLVQSV